MLFTGSRLALGTVLLLATAVTATPAHQHVFNQHHHGAAASKASGRVANPAMVDMSQWTTVSTMDAIPNYRLRVKNPGLCDTSVDQYSGYLDTAEDKHFFFWFFEARKVKREDAPLILWLNGGPGCSSFTGLLMELGPCRVSEGGNGTDHNPFSWNDRAHIIFLDQPTNVGFSYWFRRRDVNALLQAYANSELHVFGESYGGHYVPAVGKAIHEANRELESKRSLSLLSVSEEEQRILPLASIGIGNGIVNPLVQFKYFSTMACNSTYPATLPQETCDKMDAAYPTCARLLRECYRWNDGPYMDTGRNPYDVRRYCVGNGLCYEIEDDIDTYLNNAGVQKALGAEVKKFESCSEKVGTGFSHDGDHSKPFHQYVPPLLADNIREKEAFNGASDELWLVDGVGAGEVRTHENFTFLRVFGAGHMVPYDKPKESLDMINRWLDRKPY
ncbi:peptidase S10, serine carboxypeptidase [Linderina pennispora]|uniref:Carboxypeptidase n=1 Tax=Linderina pennispora TaxID=61395 RepID=A0A1Y1VPY2_9FUNG|nr:peptidase S10, serine carboxypeptidase [Linderina pennispora]ORX63372.1 peptidase S10, serine carboxypeptidase [Linderina pennispora]